MTGARKIPAQKVARRHKIITGTAITVGIAASVALAAFSPARATGVGPQTSAHYTANGNFDSSGHYLPGSLGFNVADVGSASQLASLPSGVQGLVWVGLCNGADTGFRSVVNGYIGKPNVFGFYLMDEPDPTGKWKPTCSAANLKAEADYIHANLPGTKAFIILMNLSSSKSPSFQAYTPAATDLDLYGVDPYPCRTELNGCNLDMINGYVDAAEADIQLPQDKIVPVYQTFGLGGWSDDGGGQYAVPTADQLTQILDRWAALVPTPQLDYAYSYGVQNSDQALSTLPDLQAVMKDHNTGASAPAISSPPASSVTSGPTTSSPTATPSGQSSSPSASPTHTPHHYHVTLLPGDSLSVSRG